MTTPIAVPESLVDFLEGGLSLLVGTVDHEGGPEVVRGAGAVVSADRMRLHVFVPSSTGARTRANLEGGSLLAVTFSRPIDYKTLQFKGRCVGIREATEAERSISLAYRAGLTESLYLVGMTRAVVRRVNVFPAFVVDVAIDAIYDQAPGPDAGGPLAESSFR